jgi:hypothetical protein
MSKPDIPITDKRFVYTKAIDTDIRKTFERVRREQRAKSLAIVKPIRSKQS